MVDSVKLGNPGPARLSSTCFVMQTPVLSVHVCYNTSTLLVTKSHKGNKVATLATDSVHQPSPQSTFGDSHKQGAFYLWLCVLN